MVHSARALVVLFFIHFTRHVVTVSVCEEVSGDSDGPFWSEAAKCNDCVLTEGCGYCFSTLRCIEGTQSGPLDGSPCPEWLFSENECPVVPECHGYLKCNECAAVDDCAWCASQGKCMTISETFEESCRGSVFDLPCPDSFIAGAW